MTRECDANFMVLNFNTESSSAQVLYKKDEDKTKMLLLYKVQSLKKDIIDVLN